MVGGILRWSPKFPLSPSYSNNNLGVTVTECNQGAELVDFKMEDYLGRPLELEMFPRQVTEEKSERLGT